jgi:peptide/nickel transport system permease protein
MIKRNNISSPSFYSLTFQVLKTKRKAVIAFWIVFVLILFGLFAPLIANNQPYYISVYNHTYYPLFSIGNQIEFFEENGTSKTLDAKQIDWKHLPFESAIFPPIAYSPNTSDLLNADFKSPNDEQFFKNSKNETSSIQFKFKHYLGTNKRGEDVFSGLIHGASISLLVGILSMLIASILGVSLGMTAGYFGDNKLQLKKGTLLFLTIAIIVGWFYAFQLRWYNLIDGLAISNISFLFELLISIVLFSIIQILFYWVAEKIFSKTKYFSTKIRIPIDTIIVKTIEIIISLPVIILIISVAAISKPSFTNLIIIIGFIQWTTIARIVRAEMLKIKQAEYMQVAKVVGVSPLQTLIYHALPNIISPALVSISFGIGQAILIESSLSFLGIGLPTDIVSWGSLVSSGCENFNAWWLIIFPGMCIFITILSFNILAESLREAIDVRLKK